MMMQDQEDPPPPPLPKRCNNSFVAPSLPSREQQIKSAIVVKKVCNTEFHSTTKGTTTATTTYQDCCGTQQSAAVFRHEVQNNLTTEAEKGSSKYNFDILSVLQKNYLHSEGSTASEVTKVSDSKIWSNNEASHQFRGCCEVVSSPTASSDKNNMAKNRIWTMRTSDMSNSGGQQHQGVLSLSRCLSTRRGVRRLTVFLLVGAVCFLLGVALPFMICRIARTSSITGPSLEPEGLRPRPLPLKADHSLSQLQNVLNNLLITVKTTHSYHYPRVVILLETWVSLVRSQTWFFSDTVDSDMVDRTGGHILNTNCSDNHSRTALACKMAVEFDHFLKSHKSWWCHFDDDNYVHVTRLAQLLQSHSPEMPVYLGKPSTAKPLEVFDLKAPQNVSQFWFATGGAGFCISRTLALKMAPYAADGKFVETGAHFWFPDDVTLGYIIEHILGEKLTVVPEFHSHLEPMKRLPLEDLDQQISFSYISYNGVDNILDLPGPFSKDVDPTRFYSLHCLLYNAPFCPEQKS